jgi:site-specific DNA-methyltransferase (adenine-specific)
MTDDYLESPPGYTIGDPDEDGLYNLVVNTDCRRALSSCGCLREYQFDFIFADPPFNIGQAYTSWDDDLPPDEFDVFTAQWVAACWDALAPNGVMALHGPDNLAEAYLFLARRLGFADNRIAWVNWLYNFGQCTRANWVDARCHCLIFAKGETYTWNPNAVTIESARVGYGDVRVTETVNGGQRVPGTVWGVPADGPNWGRITGGNLERQPDCPNQLPEVYLSRLIKAYTNPGQWVYDPFGGSGTTATVAHGLGRRFVTTDVGPVNCELIYRRVVGGPMRAEARLKSTR